MATRVEQTSGGAVCTSLMGRGLTTHEESNRRDKLSLMKPRLLARHAEGMGIDESLIDEADASTREIESRT